MGPMHIPARMNRRKHIPLHTRTRSTPRHPRSRTARSRMPDAAHGDVGPDTHSSPLLPRWPWWGARSPSSGGRPMPLPARPKPTSPVMSADPLNAAKPEVVGVWAKIHEGWIYVFDDGRVLSHPDFGPISERRLSPHGLDLVRRGTLAPQDLQIYVSMTTVPAEVWSDPIPDSYRPDRYAVCKLNVDGSPEDGDVLGDVGSIWRRLPAHVQALLRAGRISSFTDDSPDENADVDRAGRPSHRARPRGRLFRAEPGPDARRLGAHSGTGGLPRGRRRVADERHDLRRTG